MSRKVGMEFLKKTQYIHMDPSDQSKGLPAPPIELDYDKSKTLIPLPKPNDLKISEVSLRKCIENRQSVRKYSMESLTLEELSWLLWSTQGLKPTNRKDVTIRTVPSAGARHAFETYLLVNRVVGLQSGIYRYIASQHSLLEENIYENIDSKVKEAAYNQSIVTNSAVTFIWTVITYRMTYRYGERGFRYLHLDCGHVCQNLYLAAECIDSGVCAIAAFHDNDFNELLGFNGQDQWIIYLATVGKKI
jgi:SagB-type dehydrogenase family enzyme